MNCKLGLFSIWMKYLDYYIRVDDAGSAQNALKFSKEINK